MTFTRMYTYDIKIIQLQQQQNKSFVSFDKIIQFFDFFSPPLIQYMDAIIYRKLNFCVFIEKKSEEKRIPLQKQLSIYYKII